MLRHFSETTGHQRLVYGVEVGAGVALLPLPTAWSTQVLLAWCAGRGTFLALSWWLAAAQRVAHLALSILALAASWLLMQTIFAFHYAHLYYQYESRSHCVGKGLQFPGKQAPDYFDFLYYAQVVGMTCQVSDVVVTVSYMRRLTLLQVWQNPKSTARGGPALKLAPMLRSGATCG